jgi:hypothetical protein
MQELNKQVAQEQKNSCQNKRQNKLQEITEQYTSQ